MLVATGLANAPVKRRKASGPRRGRFRARPVRMATSGRAARTMVGMRLSALRLPFFGA